MGDRRPAHAVAARHVGTRQLDLVVAVKVENDRRTGAAAKELGDRVELLGLLETRTRHAENAHRLATGPRVGGHGLLQEVARAFPATAEKCGDRTAYDDDLEFVRRLRREQMGDDLVDAGNPGRGLEAGVGMQLEILAAPVRLDFLDRDKAQPPRRAGPPRAAVRLPRSRPLPAQNANPAHIVRPRERPARWRLRQR